MCILPDKSVDLILCDLPYGTTSCSWDTVLPFDRLWSQYERIIKDNGAIVLTSDEPFTSMLISSNLKLFRYKWIWDKIKPTGFLNSKKMPLKRFEEVCVFYKKLPTYNPQMEKGKMRRKKSYNKNQSIYGGGKIKNVESYNDEKYPTNIVQISNASQKGKIHRTQKPIELFDYFIKTYSNEGAVVVDNCIGSGTTAIACLKNNRKYIGWEWNKDSPREFYDAAIHRISEYRNTL